MSKKSNKQSIILETTDKNFNINNEGYLSIHHSDFFNRSDIYDVKYRFKYDKFSYSFLTKLVNDPSVRTLSELYKISGMKRIVQDLPVNGLLLKDAIKLIDYYKGRVEDLLYTNLKKSFIIEQIYMSNPNWMIDLYRKGVFRHITYKIRTPNFINIASKYCKDKTGKKNISVTDITRFLNIDKRTVQFQEMNILSAYCLSELFDVPLRIFVNGNLKDPIIYGGKNLFNGTMFIREKDIDDYVLFKLINDVSAELKDSPANMTTGRHSQLTTEINESEEIADNSEKNLIAMQEDGGAIKHLSDEQRTPEVCMAAVQEDGPSILHLTDTQRTPEVCLAAVQKNGYAIGYLSTEQRTPEVCLAAVQQNGYTIQYLTDIQRTQEVCLAAMQEDGCAVEYLTDTQRTPEVCLAAVQQYGRAIKYLTDEQIDALSTLKHHTNINTKTQNILSIDDLSIVSLLVNNFDSNELLEMINVLQQDDTTDMLSKLINKVIGKDVLKQAIIKLINNI